MGKVPGLASDRIRWPWSNSRVSILERIRFPTVLLLTLVVGLMGARNSRAESVVPPWPGLPERDGAVMIPAQEWPRRPGTRQIRVLVHYPGGTRAGIGPKTGIFLTLHNWGGTDCVGTADPRSLAQEFDAIAVCVNYLQSGREEGIDGPEAYDFGWFQALDALRALAWVRLQLQSAGIPHARGRIFATGGSGGGNVALMANKLAPRTFACVIDLCGMKKLTDDVAFGLPGGSTLHARWSRDPASPDFLSMAAREIRFVGHPGHLAVMKRLGNSARIISVHGVEDTSCLFEDAVELEANMRGAGLDYRLEKITASRLDGRVFTGTGHALGDRTLIPGRVAGNGLRAGGPEAFERPGPTDFEIRDEIRYSVEGGEYVISYRSGFPIGTFHPR